MGAPAEPLLIETPYGDVDAQLVRDGALEFLVVNRHGAPHCPAHVVPHRANVDAMVRAKVDRVLALHTVGALRGDLPPGTMVAPHDYLDLCPRQSFHDGTAIHVDVSEAFCPALRSALVAGGARDGGVYAATEGPRLETRAEVAMLRAMGGDVVGMTLATEAALARERALCYASLCVVTNLAAGVNGERPTAEDIRAGARALAPRAMALLLAAARTVPHERGCACGRALDAARL